MPWIGGAFRIGAAVLVKAIWWDLHLASLLTHVLLIFVAVSVIELIFVQQCFILFVQLVTLKE